MPAPPATVNAASTTRTIVTSTPRWSATPAATPANMRPLHGRRNGYGRLSAKPPGLPPEASSLVGFGCSVSIPRSSDGDVAGGIGNNPERARTGVPRGPGVPLVPNEGATARSSVYRPPPVPRPVAASGTTAGTAATDRRGLRHHLPAGGPGLGRAGAPWSPALGTAPPAPAWVSRPAPPEPVGPAARRRGYRRRAVAGARPDDRPDGFCPRVTGNRWLAPRRLRRRLALRPRRRRRDEHRQPGGL